MFDSPETARLLGRVGGFVTASRHDPRATTAKARKTFLDGFLDRVDPDRTLPEEERLRRAEAARKAYFSKLAYMSARARRARTAGEG